MADHRWDSYQHNHLSELNFFAGDRRRFLGTSVTKSQEDRQEDRQEDGQEDGRF